MAIGCCEVCDAQNVPGSIGGSPVATDVFFCFLCQGDEFDPYSEAEIEEPCPDCSGDGGHAYPVDINRFDGSLIECWSRCDTCDATGSVFEQPQLITADDLAEMCGDHQ